MGRMITLAAVAISGVLGMTALAAEPSGPSIQGNYVLEYRELPGGKQVRPPEVIGVCTFTGTYRNFNIYWTENGQPVSMAMISKYTFTPTEYTEENLYSVSNNWMGDKGVKYQTTPVTGKSPVTIKGEQIEFKLPLHGEPAVVFDRQGFTATVPDGFVDHWKKME